MLQVIKRDGRIQNFDLYKIKSSILKSAYQAKTELTDKDYEEIFMRCKDIIGETESIPVEKLQDAIEKALYLCGFRKIREAYKEHRQERTHIRETKSDIMNVIKKLGATTDRDNANVGNNFSAKLLRIASESNKWQVLANMPKDLAKLHEQLDLYYHDMDSFNLSANCLHIPTGEILRRGFNTGYGTINPPQSIEVAADLSCILMQSTQNDMFGGQSHPNFDNDLAYFVDMSRRKIYNEYSNLLYGKKEEIIQEKTEEKLIGCVKQAMQGIVYNLNTMHCLPGEEKIWILDTLTDDFKAMSMEEIHRCFEKNRFKVITLNEKTKNIEFNYILNSISQGIKKNIITIKGKHGAELRTTDDHDYLSIENNEITISKAKEVNHVVVPSDVVQCYSIENIIDLSKFHSRKTQNYLDNKIIITKDFARLLGYYVADGSVVAGSQLAFSVCDTKIGNDIVNIMESSYPNVTYKKIFFEDGSLRELRFNTGKVWTEAFKSICGENAKTKTIPKQILFGCIEIKKEFLKGYCLCDGCLKKGRYIEVSSCNKELIDKISLLLLTLGEVPYVTSINRINPFDGITPTPLYTLTITGKAENRLNLGFNCNAKLEISKENKSIKHDIHTIKALGIKASTIGEEETDVFDISVENNENFLTCANIFVHNCRAGSQVPFSSVNLGIPNSKDAALICKIFLEEYEKGLGKGEQPIFPNIIFRVKTGVNRNPEDPYYYLYKLACRVAAKRMNPTFMNIDADFNQIWYNKGVLASTMGCRTYLMENVNGEPGVEGRGNNAPTTINLPRIGIKAMLEYPENIEDRIKYFFELFDKRINQARKSLLYRFEVMKQLKVKDLPFVAGQGLMKGSEGLSENDSIEPILKQGTWGIGFIGLAETLIALTGYHHGENEKSRDLGEKIIIYLRNKCDDFKIKDKLNWSCYATPAEGLSGKFIPTDRKIYGIIPGITDKDYYTNSFHVPVNYSISIKDKISIEAPYHKLCNGGHISYIELDNYPDGDMIENIVTYAYENTNISYIGINFHIRYCKKCGEYLHGENECPKCGSKEIQGVSRVTGYLSLDERFGAGKSAERKDRSNHNGDHTNNYYLSED